MELELQGLPLAVEVPKETILQRVESGLSLDEKFPHWKENTRKILQKTIAQAYAECTVLLDVEPAEGFSYLQGKHAKKLSARMVINETTEFKFNENCLEELARTYELGGGSFLSELALDELRHIIAHETYHQREKQKFPKRTGREGDSETGEVKSRTLYFRTEKAADLFALAYIWYRKAPRFSEKISKLLTVAEYKISRAVS